MKNPLEVEFDFFKADSDSELSFTSSCKESVAPSANFLDVSLLRLSSASRILVAGKGGCCQKASTHRKMPV